MPESKIIPSLTNTTIIGSNISIVTQYQDQGENELPDTILAFIGDQAASFDGIGYIEGELMIQMKNNPTQIDYSINNNGDLVVFSNQGDVDKYSINSNGDLIYTE